MNWISVYEELTQHSNNILIWQKNLNDYESSRFQRAVFFETHFKIYPCIDNENYLKKNDWKGYDNEGDLCHITHWCEIEAPK